MRYRKDILASSAQKNDARCPQCGGGPLEVSWELPDQPLMVRCAACFFSWHEYLLEKNFRIDVVEATKGGP